MATAYKILGQARPSNTSNTTLYTVPASTEAIVSTLSVTNVTANDQTFRLFVVPSGSGAGTNNAIAYDAAIPANSFTAFTLGLTLSAGDLVVIASGFADAVTFQAFGTELS
jgi:hypothetical protein